MIIPDDPKRPDDADPGVAATDAPSGIHESFDILEDLAADDDAPVASGDRTSFFTHQDPPRRRFPKGGDVAETLAWRVLRAALPADVRRRVRRGQPVAVVLQAPGPDWVDPLRSAISRDPRGVECVAQDGSSKAHRPGVGGEKLARALTRGTSVVGISQNPSRFLPSMLLAVADAYAIVAPPDAKLLRSLFRRHARGRVPTIPEGIACGLSFSEIVAAFRAGATASDVVANLLATAKRKSAASPTDDGPSLDDLPGYPAEAMRWGRSLVDAIAAFKAGRGPWPKDCAALLYGPPGTGKTLFARALAKSCGITFVGTSVGAWFGDSKGDLGDVVVAARCAWDAAVASRPSLLLIDEVDSLPNRAHLDADRLLWWSPVIENVLLLLSGEREGLVVVGATNHPEKLDQALIRPGRLGTHIGIPAPDADGLAQVLRFHLGDALSDMDLSKVTRLAPGATPAQAEHWAHAAVQAAKEAGRAPTVDDLLAVVAPPDERHADRIRVAAVHEAGHAVAFLDTGHQLESASIIQRGSSGGVTLARMSTAAAGRRRDRENSVVAMLAGRAAEEVVLGEVSDGAVADLESATRMLADAHGVHGLGATLIHRGDPIAQLQFDRELREVVERDLQRQYARAVALMRRRRVVLERIADALVQRRFLTGEEVEKLAPPRRARASSSRPSVRTE